MLVCGWWFVFFLVCNKGEWSTWPADAILKAAELRISLYFTLKYYFMVPVFREMLACLIEA